jgi:hypothetical protein
LAPLPIIAFDGVQGAPFDGAPELRLALPIAPAEDLTQADLMAGVGQARRAAKLILAGLRRDARDRASLLTALRALGPFDAHEDPIDPPVWLWRVSPGWTLTPDRPLASPV